MIHHKVPELLLDEDLSATVFASHEAAKTWADDNSTCQRLGYTVIEWDDEQGGNGIVGTTSYP